MDRPAAAEGEEHEVARVASAVGRDRLDGADHAGVGEGVDAHAQKPPVGVERELGVGDVVPRVLVGEDRLAPLARPLDGPAKLARRPQHQLVLGILPALGAEGAADVAGDDADPVLGDLEDAAGQGVADAVRVLDVGVESVAVLDRIVDAERAPRLHVLRVHPRDDVAASDDPVEDSGLSSLRDLALSVSGGACDLSGRF